jgi:hypothetical protein
MQNHERRGGIYIGIISFNQIEPKHKRVGRGGVVAGGGEGGGG